MTKPYATKQPLSRPWMIVDIETTGRDDVAHLLEPCAPSKTLKDPAKIEADIAAKTAERDGKLALDMNTARIVSIGVMTSGLSDGAVLICVPDNEAECISQLWEWWHNYGQKRTLIGFNIRGFDIPVLIQRTRLLGLPAPALDWNRYSKEIVDLQQELQCGDGYGHCVNMRRRLKNYCKLFGIADDDEDCDGADVPSLIAAGRFDEVERHCAADILRTRDLAARLGVI